MTKPSLRQWIGVVIHAFLLTALAACGGGGGYGGGGGGGGGGTTYTVGGMVTGLTGSGLVLQNNGGSDLAISAPGTFIFTSGLMNGAAYAVTVKTQPSMQNCVISNGTGAMGTSNVTNVAVDCTIIVSGTFIGVDYGTSGDDGSLGNTALDGAGNFSSKSAENSAGTVASGIIDTGTYTVSAGGAVVLNFNDGAVNLDGNAIVLADMNNGEGPYIDIELKQGQTTFTNANLDGTYELVTYSNSGASSTLWTLTADGSGNFAGSETQNNAGVISPSNPITGSYTVAADGALILSPTVGPALTGGVSADGSSLVVSQLTPGQNPSITVGIKVGQSGFTDADLSGTYAIVGLENSGDAGALWVLTFDGAGNISGTGKSNDAGTISNITLTGTYSVAADGALTVNPTGGQPLTGSISADGKGLVFTNLKAGDAPSIWFGVNSAVFSPWDY